jgi:ADP-heptose:LPS heptosyltransferase
VFAENPFVERTITPEAGDLRLPRLAGWLRELTAEYRGWGLLDLHGNLRSRLLGLLWRGPVLRYPKEGLARRVFLVSGGRFCGPRLRAASVAMRYARAVEKTPPPSAAVLPRLWLAEAEQAEARAHLAAIFPDGGAAPVALHPYAAHALKSWPETRWRELAALLDERGQPWLVIGRGKPLFPGDPRDNTNATTLRQSAALLARCRCLVTGDSGPMHLATAVGTRVVALFGPTTREWGFFPAGPGDRVLERDCPCRPCSLHGKPACPRAGECLGGITAEEVFAALAL